MWDVIKIRGPSAPVHCIVYIRSQISEVTVAYLSLNPVFTGPLLPPGLANKKAVALDAGSEGFEVVLTTKKTKKGQNPVEILNKTVLKKNFRKMALAIESQVRSEGIMAEGNRGGGGEERREKGRAIRKQVWPEEWFSWRQAGVGER